MKLCVISTNIFQLGTNGLSGYGGLEQIAWACAKGLAEKGHDVSLVAPDGSVCPGVKVIEGGPAGRADEKFVYSKVWQRLTQFDAIVDHGWAKYSYIGKREGVIKCPVLGVLHAPVNTMMQSLPPGVDKPCFVAISDDQKAHFEALFSHPARRIYNGLDAETFYKPLDVPRTDRFLFLARFSSIKGADIALKACLEAGVGLDLVGDTKITGEPEYYQQCCQLAEQSSPTWDHSKGKQLRIVGGVSRGETVWFYSQARAMLHLCPHFREPFGLAPLEAQACGNGVLCWDMGAMRETVKHGETGFIVKSADEAAEVLRSGALDSLSRTRCREWASQFSIQRMVDGYESAIVDAVENGGW